ncbi:conserved hypothetical protein [Trichinella spiralis]|uniref:hypothetical protein n=1 Tax=Trichinella spiralis TaxID=6334 RepID=UPI0001EFEE45|nr:conserved hypothetical protein [Trichinella spiralis]
MARSFLTTNLLFTILAVILYHHVKQCQGQELNDPARNYIEGRLGNRRIWWCPSGYVDQLLASVYLQCHTLLRYLSFCPQPTDWDNYNWCCTWPYMGTWKPSCCPFAIPTGAVVAVIIAGVVLTAVLIALSCWCCYCCPLYKQLYEY